VVKALFPLWATVLVLLATRIQGFGLRGWLSSPAPAMELPLGAFGIFSISPALVVQLRGILGEPEVNWTHRVLYVPSLIPFIAISLIALWVFRAPAGTGVAVLRDAAVRMRRPVLALLGALVFVQLMRFLL
jgi:lactate permease